MIREILLSKGQVALVDDEDYDYLVQWKWHAAYIQGKYYAIHTKRYGDWREGKSRKILMHRVILNAPPEYLVDHINGNTLDNRRDNLRLADTSQNLFNTNIRTDNTTGYKGVHWDKKRQKWMARIAVRGKRLYLGLFDSLNSAVTAYKEASELYHGDFANTERRNT